MPMRPRRLARIWLPPLGLVALGALAQALGLEAAARYDRDAVAAGEVWRLLSGQLLHLGWSHWAWNSAGLLLLWSLFHPFLGTGRGLLALAAGAAGVAAGLLGSGVQWYVGLSGALHGLFAAGVIAALRREPRWAAGLAAVLIGKLGYEALFGPLPGTREASGGPVLTAAHLWGALGGALAALLQRCGTPAHPGRRSRNLRG